MNECYISVDIETTGPTPGMYSMFEIGAWKIGSDEYFERHIALISDTRFSPDALRAIGRTENELLLRRGSTPFATMDALLRWVKKVSKNSTPILVANNAPFDWMFVAYYFDNYSSLRRNPFGHSALDMKAYFMGMTGCSWKEATLKNMAAYSGVKFEKLPHRALEDAIIQGRIFQKLISMKRKPHEETTDDPV